MALASVVAWPEPKPLWSNGPRHIGYRWKALVIVRTILTLYQGQNVGVLEKERKSYPHCTYCMFDLSFSIGSLDIFFVLLPVRLL
jgi:hypothetical protein